MKHKYLKLIIAVALIALTLFLVHQHDRIDYEEHMQYAEMNNCTWDYSGSNWGVCK